MNFELLPNEILFDIFDYLDGVDVLRAFYGINSHFNSLLHKQYRSYHFKFNSISKHYFDTICKKHLPFITERIIMLSLSDDGDTPEQINLFRSYIPSFCQFTQLRSLSLFNLRSYNTLMKIVDECQHLSHLAYFNVYSYSSRFDKNQLDFQSIVNRIWNFPQLIHCNIDISIDGQSFFPIPIKISTSLQYLNMYNNLLRWNQISNLFEYTPHLKRISMYIMTMTGDNYAPFSLLTLIDLNVRIVCTSDIWNIVAFLRNTPNLRRLHISLLSNLIGGRQWEEIICNYLPKLKVFQLNMEETLPDDHNIQEHANQLINSFRNSFWIDEHQWFVRCITTGSTIHLYTLSKLFYHLQYKRPDSWQSTYPGDTEQELYHNIIHIYDHTFFDSWTSSNIVLSNIRKLHIKLPIYDQFWSIVSNLNRLNSLNVSGVTDTLQSQLQVLLDQAPRLNTLTIRQDESLSFQLSLFEFKNATVRKLHLEYYHYFNREQCITLTQSPLGAQCQILYIQVEHLECIIIIVKNMINLRALYFEGTLARVNENDKFLDAKIINKVEPIQWLKDRLPSTCLIVRDPYFLNRTQIWIK